MRTRTSLSRTAGLLAAGGFLVQLAGCAAGIAPVYFSLAESTILMALLGGMIFP